MKFTSRVRMLWFLYVRWLVLVGSITASPLRSRDGNSTDASALESPFGPATRPQYRFDNFSPYVHFLAGPTGHCLLYVVDRMWRRDENRALPPQIYCPQARMWADVAYNPSATVLPTSRNLGWAVMMALNSFISQSTYNTQSWPVGRMYFTPPSSDRWFLSMGLALAGPLVQTEPNNTVEVVKRKDKLERTTQYGVQNPDLDMVYTIAYRGSTISHVSMLDLVSKFLVRNVFPQDFTRPISPQVYPGSQLVVGPNNWGDFMTIEFTKVNANYENENEVITWAIISQAILSACYSPIRDFIFLGFLADIKLAKHLQPEVSDTFLRVVMNSTRRNTINTFSANLTSNSPPTSTFNPSGTTTS